MFKYSAKKLRDAILSDDKNEVIRQTMKLSDEKITMGVIYAIKKSGDMSILNKHNNCCVRFNDQQWNDVLSRQSIDNIKKIIKFMKENHINPKSINAEHAFNKNEPEEFIDIPKINEVLKLKLIYDNFDVSDQFLLVKIEHSFINTRIEPFDADELAKFVGVYRVINPTLIDTLIYEYFNLGYADNFTASV